ncbi:MAG: type II secretion system F family protein, partial [Bdellovibrionales bacterium]|nr:type II secretion system F family protein [Bdellovibrionales bacterium]
SCLWSCDKGDTVMALALGSRYAELNRTRILLGQEKKPAQQVEASHDEAVTPSFIQRELEFAGIATAKQLQSLVLSTASASLVLASIAALILPLSFLFVIPLFVMLLWLRLQRLSEARAKAFEKDYTAMLLSLASAVRTGMDPMVALLHGRKLFPRESLVAQELERLKQLVEQGLREELAVSEFARSIRHPDLALFKTAFILARKEGSSLGVCLQRLARVTRQRQSFRRKVKSAVAMQRLSALGIGACAVAIGIMQFTANPDAMMKTLQHPLGFKVLCGGMFLIVFGITWMLRMARSRV